MRRNYLMAFLLGYAVLIASAACTSTRSSPAVNRHDPAAVLNAYFAAWAHNDTNAQTSFMTPNYARLASEPVESLRVLSVRSADGASPTKRVYSVSFEVTFKGGRSLSMESGAYNWTYALTWEATRDSWLVANYGAG
jgi:hypothetical protein